MHENLSRIYGKEVLEVAFLFSEFAGRHAGHLFKNLIEKFKTVVSALLRNGMYRKLCVRKQAAAFFDAAVLQVLRKGEPGLLSEFAADIGKAVMDLAAEGLQRQVCPIVFVDLLYELSCDGTDAVIAADFPNRFDQDLTKQMPQHFQIALLFLHILRVHFEKQITDHTVITENGVGGGSVDASAADFKVIPFAKFVETPHICKSGVYKGGQKKTVDNGKIGLRRNVVMRSIVVDNKIIPGF